ncbi:MAG: DNA mismatch repair protein MutS [Candidatus Omnitrophota bacterium]|jgi:DNA mismatch repair protein MutS|nr:MAG: DNA mismatch repair protein MutS [Candidatus Omnitrophota bacterium]
MNKATLNHDDYSPMMQQYLAMKEQCGDAILFFRCGDFYEMFMDDAIKAAEELDIALTKKAVGKGQTAPLAGIPYHAVQNYLYRLTRKGYRVAVCEQTELPQKGKKIVNRELVRTISPGTIIDADVIDGKENNYLAALHNGDLSGWGLACVDVTTGEFRATWANGMEGWHTILAELGTLNPSEILVEEASAGDEDLVKQLKSQADCMVTGLPRDSFLPGNFERYGVEEFRSAQLKPNGGEAELTRAAAAAILAYLNENQKSTLDYMKTLEIYQRESFLVIDKNTERHLELLASAGERGKKFSLLGVLDLTVTAMGGRLLRQWILRPLTDVQKIIDRQSMVQLLHQQPNLRDELRKTLRSVHDLERLLGRVTFGNANARDLTALRASLEQLPGLNQWLDEAGDIGLIRHALHREEDPDAPTDAVSPTEELIDSVMEVRELLTAALLDDPPLTVREGGMIRDGYDEELDELRSMSKDGRGYIARLQEQEREKTGIPSLRVSYNRVFGYYIEITNIHKNKAPEHYIRKQTLANAERFITPELKEFEAKVLHAEDRIKEIEYKLLQNLLEAVRGYGPRLKTTARMIARLDVFQSLAEAASRNGYCRPQVHRGGEIEIKEGRHPVLERAAVVDHFVPNDCRLDQEKEQILLITGPNMAGKSTYIRQIALIVLMAQMGSFTPAQSASIGVIDRLFSRIGASDDLARGRSTFMVEMSEAAHILTNATPRSLVILDEIGRGTSTFDGVSLAWAIIEYLHGLRAKGVKTLFATHYHELASLAETHKRVANYHVQIAEEGDGIRFLYRIAPGHTDHSYGIHVADLAGVPKRVIHRARKMLKRLERGEHLALQAAGEENKYQISLFSMLEEPLRARLSDIDMDTLSPKDAWHILHELTEEAKRG